MCTKIKWPFLSDNEDNEARFALNAGYSVYKRVVIFTKATPVIGVEQKFYLKGLLGVWTVCLWNHCSSIPKKKHSSGFGYFSFTLMCLSCNH